LGGNGKFGKIYVANSNNASVSVINGSNDKRLIDIDVGRGLPIFRMDLKFM
jgi:YVTN family beta-propeller protein